MTSPLRVLRPRGPIVSLGFTCFHFEAAGDELAPVESLMEFRRLAMESLIKPPQARWLPRRRLDGRRPQLLAPALKKAG